MLILVQHFFHHADFHWLPVELWLRILKEAVGNDNLVLYKHLKMVSRTFRDVAERIDRPQPKVYINAFDGDRLKITPLASRSIVSYSWLIETAGISSGAALALQSMFHGCLHRDTVMVLEHFMLGWYRIIDVLYTSPDTLNAECEFFTP